MLLRLRTFLNRPVAWGAVILSYIGIFAGFAFAVYTFNDANDAERRQAAALVQQSNRADAAIVRTGRISILNGCVFDNQRAGELRGILHRSLHNQRLLRREGVLPRHIANRNIRITRSAVRSISLRNCEAAAAQLTADPNRER